MKAHAAVGAIVHVVAMLALSPCQTRPPGKTALCRVMLRAAAHILLLRHQRMVRGAWCARARFPGICTLGNGLCVQARVASVGVVGGAAGQCTPPPKYNTLQALRPRTARRCTARPLHLTLDARTTQPRSLLMLGREHQPGQEHHC